MGNLKMQIKNSRMTKQISLWLAISFLAAAPGLCNNVTLKSKPSNATVFNDQNIKQGVTPLYMGPYFSAKQYQVRKKGYLPQNVTIHWRSPSVVEVELQVDPNAQLEPVRPAKVRRSDNDEGEVDDASADTLKRLRALKTIRDSGDISEEEYSTMRTRILDTLIPLETQDSSRTPEAKQSGDSSESVASRKAAAMPPKIMTSVDEPRFGIKCRIVDDTAGGVAIIGNGDGRVQPGEVFDMVVVVTNASDAIAEGIVCSMTLIGNQALKTFSGLHQTCASLAASEATTFRFNLAMSLNAKIAEVSQCVIEVKSTDISAEYYEYTLPTDFP